MSLWQRHIVMTSFPVLHRAIRNFTGLIVLLCDKIQYNHDAMSVYTLPVIIKREQLLENQQPLFSNHSIHFSVIVFQFHVSHQRDSKCTHADWLATEIVETSPRWLRSLQTWSYKDDHHTDSTLLVNQLNLYNKICHFCIRLNKTLEICRKHSLPRCLQ